MLLQRLRQSSGQAPVLTAAAEAEPSPWVVRYRPNPGARMRLFCFSYAGGGASVFRTWPEALPPDVELCAIQLPGRESRIGQPAFTRIGPLLAAVAAAIEPYLDRPFAFYGHSMGALVSFELARQLRRASGRLPLQLYLAAYRAPHLPNPNFKIYHLPSEVFKVVLRAEGTAEMILQNEELMKVMLPTLRADFELCDTYEHRTEPPLECPLAIFGGLDDVRISTADLEEWPRHAGAGCSLTMLPGGHFFLHSAQAQLCGAIADSLQQHLDALGLRERAAGSPSR
ncbi:thioesterase [Chloroflexia bacterium SDU3-3]|nr:thioesterase [Chloroflexia bacterium SDU3-3]